MTNIEANKSLVVICLQNLWEYLSFVTFHRVQSKWKGVSNLPRQNKYFNLKTTCHTKPKLILWTKLLKNLLLANYLISVPVALMSLDKIINKYLDLKLSKLTSFVKPYIFDAEIHLIFALIIFPCMIITHLCKFQLCAQLISGTFGQVTFTHTKQKF